MDETTNPTETPDAKPTAAGLVHEVWLCGPNSQQGGVHRCHTRKPVSMLMTLRTSNLRRG
jgi:hypothetical protein